MTAKPEAKPEAKPMDAAPPIAAKVPASVEALAQRSVAKPAATKVQPKSQPAKPATKPVVKKPVVAVAAKRPAKTSSARIGATTAKKEIRMDVTDKAKAMFADMNDRTKGAVEKTTKAFEEMNSFSKGNIEAVVASSKIAAKGIETMGQDAADYAKTSIESATAAFKTLAATKSPTEFLKLQGDFMRQSFDAMIAHGSRSTEAMLKLAGEVAQPISNQVTLATEKMKVAA